MTHSSIVRDAVKELQFWWTYLTNSSFRGYVHMHDYQKFLSHVENMRQDQLNYASRMALSNLLGNKDIV